MTASASSAVRFVIVVKMEPALLTTIFKQTRKRPVPPCDRPKQLHLALVQLGKRRNVRFIRGESCVHLHVHLRLSNLTGDSCNRRRRAIAGAGARFSVPGTI